MSDFEDQLEVIFSSRFCNKYPRNYLRSLSPIEKVEKLVQLQNQYYQMLIICEQNGGKPIPEKWRKWHKARFES